MDHMLGGRRVTASLRTLLRIVFTLAVAVGPWRLAAPQAAHSSLTRARRPSIVVTGSVVDSLTNLPLHGVTLIITGPPGVARQRVSDQAGRFRFDSILPGSYVISTAHRLLDTTRVTFRVAASDSVFITLATRGRVAAPLLSSGRRAQIAALDSARTRWLSLRPAAYRFHVRDECFCFPGPPGSTTEVRGNVVTLLGTDGVRHLVTPDSSKAYDIGGLFDFMTKVVIDDRMELKGVEYDATYGYPRKFTTESSLIVTDTWVHYFIEDFQVVAPRAP